MSAVTAPSGMALCDKLCAAVLIAALVIAFPSPVFEAAHMIGWCMFAALAALRVAASLVSLAPMPPPPTAGEDFAPYTIICPLYREADQVQALIAALARMDYPEANLQIILALEGDDAETVAACARPIAVP